MYDVLIIGGGPASMTAAIYAGRALLKVAVIESQYFGGQAAITDIIDNYPGFPEGISGPELVWQMEQQLDKYGAEKIYGTVVAVIKKGEGKKQLFEVELDSKDVIEGRSIIVATGAAYRNLNIPGETKFTGNGVSYCATCDGAFFKDMDVFVVGGGDSAVKEAMFLCRFASKVTIVHRRDELRAEKIIQEQAFANPKIHFLWDSVVTSISGDVDGVKSAVVKNVKTGELSTKTTEGLFIFIGRIPNSGMVKNLVETDDSGYIKVDSNMQTVIPGIFAAGDVRQGPLKQVITACGDGAAAAFMVEQYVHDLKH